MRRRLGFLVLTAVLLGVSGVSWGQKKATVVLPADGATDVVFPALMWAPGSTAVFHTLYVGTTPQLGPADMVKEKLGRGNTSWVYAGEVTPGTTYYWRVDEIEKDLVTVIQGDVWSFTIWPFWAFMPDPADGSNTAPIAPNLQWLIGQNVLTHHVYFSADKAAVTDGAAEADKGTVVEPNYAPGTLEPATVYFWRVDEIDVMDTVVPGAVWSFTTMFPIDDFESYTNELGQRVFQTWIDGWGFTEPAPGNPGNGTGATVGYDPTKGDIMEMKIVRGGLQSMPFDFNNMVTPFYSEADRSWDSAQDWTAGGVDTLVVHFRGQGAKVNVQPVTTAPVIDGKHDAMWAQASVQFIRTKITGDDLTGPLDASGQFRILYDAANLYALVDINDEKLYNDSGSAYLDDSVEFYVDGDNSKAPSPLSGNNRQYTFGWNATDIQGTNTATTGVEFAQVNTATGWCIEMKFPWQALRGAGAPVGQFIGVDCFYNDDDNGADTRESQIAWNSTLADDWQTAADWGTAYVTPPQTTAAGNDRLYIVVQDAANHTAVITHPDAGIISSKEWVEWAIPLSEFAAGKVNLAAVRKLTLGVGDRAQPTKGSAGTLFFDDIYLTRPAPAKE